MRRQLICMVILTTLAAFPAVADEVEPNEEPNPVRETPTNAGGEVPVPAQATQPEETATEEGGMSAECIAFRADIDANIGDIMRAGCEPTLGQMSKLMDNPIGNVAMWINQVDVFQLTNDEVSKSRDETQVNYMGIIQVPTSISENWSIIHRAVYSVPSFPMSQNKIDNAGGLTPPSQPPGGGGPGQPPASRPDLLPIDLFSGRTTGFGDMYYVGLVSPKAAPKIGDGSLIWGLGVNQSFPTATDDVLGTGKWSTGPAAIAGYLGPKVKVAGLIQNYFSHSGDSKRDKVKLTNLQYFYYYSLSDVMSIGAGPNVIANWEAGSGDKWTVPIGLGINRTFQIGKVPVRIGAEAFYNVVRPDSIGSDWGLRFFVIPAVPAALFKWTSL
jgi:hypothetical protein